MEFKIQLAKGKNLWTKDIILNKVYIYINWPKEMWYKLTEQNLIIKLRVWDTDLVTYLWDSSTPIRFNQDSIALVHLMVDVNPIVVWMLLVNKLTLIIE